MYQNYDKFDYNTTTRYRILTIANKFNKQHVSQHCIDQNMFRDRKIGARQPCSTLKWELDGLAFSNT